MRVRTPSRSLLFLLLGGAGLLACEPGSCKRAPREPDRRPRALHASIRAERGCSDPEWCNEVVRIDCGSATDRPITCELIARITAQGHTPRPDRWEVYVAGPESGADPAKWRAELHRPLAG